MRLHFFEDVSEEAMCIVAYLQDEAEAALRLTYMVGKCHVAPIRHMAIPNLGFQATVCGVTLRKQIISEHYVRVDEIYHWIDSSTVLQWLQAAHNKTSVRCKQSNRDTGKFIDRSIRHVKGVNNLADIGTREISIEGLRESVCLNGLAGLQKDEDKWPKPWCQQNELEREQAIIAVATEPQAKQPFY